LIEETLARTFGARRLVLPVSAMAEGLRRLGHSPLGKERCRGCARRVARYDALRLDSGGTAELVCSRCFNEAMARLIELDFRHPSFRPVRLVDRRGVAHDFHFRTSLLPTGLLLEGFELWRGEPSGPRIALFGGVRDDPRALFAVLLSMLREALDRREIFEDLARGIRRVRSPLDRERPGFLSRDGSHGSEVRLFGVSSGPELGARLPTPMGDS